MKHPEVPLSKAHDIRWIHAAWRKVVKSMGGRMFLACECNGYPVYGVSTKALARTKQGGIYLSAGIHGDEPGAVHGLLAWADKNAAVLAEKPILIFPCLNPWGLVNNARTDAEGADLNRIWNNAKHPLVQAVISQIDKTRFSLAATLHEDFDADGFYLYEPGNGEPDSPGTWIAGEIVAQGFSADRRSKIEGMKITAPGLIRRKKIPSRLRENLPEALFLLRHMDGSVFTFETPSETDLQLRISMQSAFLDALVSMHANCA